MTTAVFTPVAFSNVPQPPPSASVVEMRSASSRVVVSEPVRGWSDGVKARFNELVRLPEGWDGYHGLPVSFVNANFALRLLESVCDADAPAPQIVPGGAGDLQIEWHTNSADVEVHVVAPNQVVAWRRRTGADEELTLSNDFTVIARWVSEMVELPLASGTATA